MDHLTISFKSDDPHVHAESVTVTFRREFSDLKEEDFDKAVAEAKKRIFA